MTRKPFALVVSLVGLAAAAFLAFGLSDDGPAPSADREVEITDYEGVRLGSVEDFRENSIRGVQTVDPETYRLTIDGLVAQSASYTLDELSTNERMSKLVTLHCVEGWSVQALWEGIPLRSLLEEASPLEGATTLIFHAEDGYTTSLPLSFVLDRDLIIADVINGITLPAETGFPFQLVAESKWGYKWIRWLTRIKLSNDPEYEGFWERRGYSNDADLDKPYFDF